MAQRNENEKKWNKDLIELLKEKIKCKKIEIESKKVLRDIVVQKGKKNGYELQLGFFDQDIVIYKDSMKVGELKNSPNIKLHNNNKDNNKATFEIIIPKIIIELKYWGVNTHTLIAYSDIAHDIKSIFPKAKYILLLRYKTDSSNNKLLRNSRDIDKIIYFEDYHRNKNKQPEYKKGKFKKTIENKSTESKAIQKKFKSLKTYIKEILKEDNLFVK